MSAKLEKHLVQEGNGKDYPKKGDQVAMNYTGWLFDAKADQNRGSQSVSLPPATRAIC
jgi:FK506-binding protein 1